MLGLNTTHADVEPDTLHQQVIHGMFVSVVLSSSKYEHIINVAPLNSDGLTRVGVPSDLMIQSALAAYVYWETPAVPSCG